MNAFKSSIESIDKAEQANFLTFVATPKAVIAVLKI